MTERLSLPHFHKEWKRDVKQKDQMATAGEGLPGKTGLN